MAGRFNKNDKCYNREEDERFGLYRPYNNQSDCIGIKTMLRLLVKRLENKAKYFIGETQFGFRKGCGMWEEISVMSSRV